MIITPKDKLISDFTVRVWKSQEEGLDMIEEAAGILEVKVRRLDKGVYVGGAVVKPSLVPVPTSSKTQLRGFQAVEVLKGADGKPSLGRELYNGLNPASAIRFAMRKMSDGGGR